MRLGVFVIALLYSSASAGFLGASSLQPKNYPPLPLIKLDEYVASFGAMCLDGTPAAYYLRTIPGSNKWMLYFEGGGWCYSPEDCLGRSTTQLGSSKEYPSVMDDDFGGLLSRNGSSNVFSDYNLVYMKYCDGNSFSGNLEGPYVVNGTGIYFRGKANREAILDHVLKTTALAQATHVIQTGCSAGGLAAFLHADAHADWARANLRSAVSFVNIPISGFFLNENNALNEPVYPAQIRTIFKMSNASSGLNPACVRALPEEDAWKCNFAEFSFAFSKVRTFALMSQMDAWAAACIFAAEPVLPGSNLNGNCSAVPSFQNCGWNISACPGGESFSDVIKFQQRFRDRISSNAGILRDGNGGYFSSCFTHCEGQDQKAWTNWRINGVAMNEAVARWYFSAEEEISRDHTYIDCLLNEEAPHTCNDSCTSYWESLVF